MNTANNKEFEAQFSVLIMSIASSAAMSMGLTPDPQTGHTGKDKKMARFNIDLLVMLKDKTKNNLTDDEKKLIDSLLLDLQNKFIQIK